MNRCWRALAAAALGVGMPAASHAACRVLGQEPSLGDGTIVVHPFHADPFEVRVDAGPARVTLGTERRAGVKLEVDGTVSFKAEARGLWYTVKAKYATPDGMVRLLPGAQLVDLRARAGDAVGSVVVTADDYLPGDDRPPDEVIQGVQVPCGALTLDSVEEDFDLELLRTFGLGTDGTWWEAKGEHETVELRSEPRSSAPARTVTNGVDFDGHFAWGRLESRGEWVKVARLGRSVALVGWLRRSALERTELEGGRRGGCAGLHGRGMFQRPPNLRPRSTKARRTSRSARRSLRTGTAVRGRPCGSTGSSRFAGTRALPGRRSPRSRASGAMTSGLTFRSPRSRPRRRKTRTRRAPPTLPRADSGELSGDAGPSPRSSRHVLASPWCNRSARDATRLDLTAGPAMAR